MLERKRALLPFDIASLEQARLSYGVYSSKVGAGKEEIHISGNGEVKLLYTMSYNSQPVVRTGTAPRDSIIRLLELFESEGFTKLDKEYVDSEAPDSTRIIGLLLEDRQFTVSVVGGMVPQFERLVGAMKMVASLAHPDVSRGSFFPHL